MKLKKIVAKNFLSYEYFEYDFLEKPLMIQGVNLTDDKQKSSGSGKSGIGTMVEYSLTGENSRGVRDIEIIQFGANGAELDLFLECGVRKEELHIHWDIKLKGSNVVKIKSKKECSKWSDVSYSNVNDGKKWILNWLGISKEDLFNYYIVNRNKFKSFFASSNKSKIELISRFSDSSILDGVEKIDNSKLISQKNDFENQLAKTQGAISVTNENLEDEKNRDLKNELEERKEHYQTLIDNLENQIINIENENVLLGQDSKDELELIVELKENIEDLKNQIKKIDFEISENLKAENEVKVSLNELQEKLNKFESNDYSIDKQKQFDKINLINDEKFELECKKTSVDELKNDLLQSISKIKNRLSGLIKCPNCEHEFELDSKCDKDSLIEEQKEIEKKKDLVNKDLEEISNKIIHKVEELNEPKEGLKRIELLEQKDSNKRSKVLNEINELNISINNFNKHKNELLLQKSNLENKVKQENFSIDNCNKNINYNDNEIIANKNSIEEIRLQIIDKQKESKELKISPNDLIISKIEKELKKLALKERDLQKQVSKVEDEIMLLNEWEGNFKNFKTFIANKSLEVMEYHTNRYLTGIGSDLRVKYDGYKVLSNGTIKDDITASVIRNEKRTFQSFSGGEQAFLLFASILCNRHMINDSNPYGGLDFLIIDEVLEGADSLVLKSLVEESKKLNTCIMIITHVSDEEVSGDVLRIVKRNGLSKIE